MSGRHVEMGDGAEFDAIRRLIAGWGPHAEGIGDDAATVTCPDGEQLVVSTDACVEAIHFRREWLTAEEVGGRAAAAALSDLAAMAATPRALLLSIVLPTHWRDELAALGRGVGDVAAAAACPIVGGNISAGGELSLTITVIGSAASPLRRSGAQVGDGVYVTGALGGPAAALRALYSGAQVMAVHLARFASPVPRLREARWLAERGARAAIDISDGLLGDAAHLARASGVSIAIDASAVPCLAGITSRNALTSGEEYELLVSMPPDARVDTGEFAESFGIPVTRIGTVVPQQVEAVLLVGAGARRGGHDHLS